MKLTCLGYAWATVAAFAATAQTARAADWQYVTSSDVIDVYVDVDSIRLERRDADTYKTAWVKWNQERDTKVSQRETVSKYFFDCDTQQSDFIYTVKYKADGSVLTSDKYDYLEMHPHAPDSIGAETVEFVCGR